MIELRPVLGEDAVELYELAKDRAVTNNLCWDGPESFDEYRAGLERREGQMRRGEIHMFTIVEVETGSKIGSIDVRPYQEGFVGDLGLWIGKPYHGRGYGSLAVAELLRYSFGQLAMEKLEAKVFVGNQASRRMFEKLGFTQEGTIRSCVRKQGRLIDEWLFGILRSEFFNQ